MSQQDFAIDLVYLWVDGNDPEWVAKKKRTTGVDWKSGDETNSRARYISNDELKFALRSVEKHAPWVRRIFIVTDNQVPNWLDVEHPAIQLVDHKEILPAKALPCFNSLVIEYFLYKIPGLSEYFLYGNDDMLFNSDVSPNYFFAEDGFPIVRLRRKRFAKWRYRWKEWWGKDPGHYKRAVKAAVDLVAKKTGKRYSGEPHHNIDAYRKSDYQHAVQDIFNDIITQSVHHRVRTDGDLLRAAFSYYALAVGRGHLQYVTRHESYKVDIQREGYGKQILRYQPTFFCMNDNQFVREEDREQSRTFLESLFKTKSAFEL